MAVGFAAGGPIIAPAGAGIVGRASTVLRARIAPK